MGESHGLAVKSGVIVLEDVLLFPAGGVVSQC